MLNRFNFFFRRVFITTQVACESRFFSVYSKALCFCHCSQMKIRRENANSLQMEIIWRLKNHYYNMHRHTRTSCDCTSWEKRQRQRERENLSEHFLAYQVKYIFQCNNAHLAFIAFNWNTLPHTHTQIHVCALFWSLCKCIQTGFAFATIDRTYLSI